MNANDEDYGYQWYLSAKKDAVVSPRGRRCLNFLNWFHRGIYHDARNVLRVDWSNDSDIVGFIYRTHVELNTYDNNTLTRLVVGAHDWAIRISIRACNPRYLELMLSPRVRYADEKTHQLYYTHPRIGEHINIIRGQDPHVDYKDPPIQGPQLPLPRYTTGTLTHEDLNEVLPCAHCGEIFQEVNEEVITDEWSVDVFHVVCFAAHGVEEGGCSGRVVV